MVVDSLKRAMPNARTRNCAGAPAQNTTTFYESVAAIRNRRKRANNRAEDSMIEGRDHRDDVDESISLDDVLLDGANLLQVSSRSTPRRTGRVSWHLVARGSTRESWRWGGGLRLHLPSLHPPEIVVPSHDQDRHVELIVASCLFAACGRSQLHFMAAYLYHAVAKGL